MRDVSPHALIQSFVSGLGDFLETLTGGPQKPTVQKSLWCASSTASLTADRDYTIVGVVPMTTGSFTLAAAPTTVAALAFANNVSMDVIAAINSTTQVGAFPNLRWEWRSGTKIYLVSTSGMGVVLVLET